MSIERAALPFDINSMDMDQAVDVEIIPDIEEGVAGAFFDEEEAPEFNDNLAEFMEEGDMQSLASELITEYESDRASRLDWEKTYIEGLDLLGLKFEERTKPWDGACGVFHPMLAEAVIRFQAQTIQEIFPASGPAKAKTVGKQTRETEKQAARVVGYLNYLATEKMVEYRDETEKLLFNLPIAGSAFRKTYYDPSMKRPCSMFVPADDFVVSYSTTSLETCQRATHVMREAPNRVKKMQHLGWYRDIELGDPTADTSDIRKKIEELTGTREDFEFDGCHTILEMLVVRELDGFDDDGIAKPYVITLDKGTGEILSIRRNWREEDDTYSPRSHFTHYQYLPGLGFYGFGLVHMVGGLSKSATSLLRQLVDAGTLSNLPGGLKTRGLRIKGDDSPIEPGEYRDVDVPSGTIKDNIAFLPYKEPSNVLYQLLGDIVGEGRRFASAADVKASDMNSEAPVGTTLAILEREMKVLSAVQARIHHAMGRELRILSGLVADHGPEKYPYETDDDAATAEDFDGRIDVIAVSDPNSGTMAQRIMQYQAALQLSATAPQLYDLPFLHRQMLEVLGLRDADRIVPLEDDLGPTDPVTENMNLITGKPLKAFLYQDHEAHIETHIAAQQNPQIMKLMENHPNVKGIMGAMSAHIAEHLAFAYRHKIEQELGIPLPPPEEKLPEDIELRLSRLVAPAAQQLTGKAQKMAQAEENAEKSKDPVLQQAERELDIKEQSVKNKAQEAQAKNDLAKMREKIQAQLKSRDIDSKERIAAAQLAEKILSDKLTAEREGDKLTSQQHLAGFQTGLNIAKDMMDDLKMNNSNE
jgi:hypothetical protein